MTQLQPIPQPKAGPLMGNLRDVDGQAPVQGFMRLAKAYGPIYQLELFGYRLISLSSQELVNEVCDESRFVQHRLWQDRADVAELFRQGANVYTALLSPAKAWAHLVPCL